MDTKQRISHTEKQIEKLQTELNKLHLESQSLQRRGAVPPSSMDPQAIALAARQSAELQSELQPKLAGIHSAVGALQPVLQQYLRELAGLKLQQKELEEREAERLARLELEKSGERLSELSTQMERAMLETHAAGVRLNSLRGLGGSIKYQSATNQLPTFLWQKGCFYLSSRQVNFRQLDEKTLAKQYLPHPGTIRPQVNVLQIQTDINALEIRITELREELSGYRAKLSQFEHHRRGPEVSWSANLRHAIAQKGAMLEEAEAKLKELKAQIGEAHAAR